VTCMMMTKYNCKQTNNMKDTLVSLYDFYLKGNEVGEDTRHQ